MSFDDLENGPDWLGFCLIQLVLLVVALVLLLLAVGMIIS